MNRARPLTLLLLFSGLSVGAPDAVTAELKPHTQAAFEKYVRAREERMEAVRVKGGHFLWTDDSPDRASRVRSGQTLIDGNEGKPLVEIKDGLIHDWVGALFISGATLPKVLAVVQNYDSHKKFYPPEVIDSKLRSRRGEEFKIYYRLLKHKVLTVVLNTEHEVRYFPLDATRQYSQSKSTRIAEVDNAGTPGEREQPPGDDHGFLWRLYSYWRFQERDGGVYVECEAISLSRGIPFGFGWVITPIIRDLPRESLTNTLERTRAALVASTAARR